MLFILPDQTLLYEYLQQLRCVPCGLGNLKPSHKYNLSIIDPSYKTLHFEPYMIDYRSRKGAGIGIADSPFTIMSTTDQLTQQEKQAYIILSELFLDTEHTELDFNYFTSSLRPLGIPVLTLEHMLRYDLFPILSPNLLSVAGVWDGFDKDWLLQQVQARRSAAGPGWIRSGFDSLAWLSLGLIVRPQWDKVKGGLNEGSNARLCQQSGRYGRSG
jgi:hypothetical protein